MYDVIEYTTYDIPPAAVDMGYAEYHECVKDDLLMRVRLDKVIISYKENIAGDYTHYIFLVISRDGRYDNIETARLAFEVS